MLVTDTDHERTHDPFATSTGNDRKRDYDTFAAYTTSADLPDWSGRGLDFGQTPCEDSLLYPAPSRFSGRTIRCATGVRGTGTLRLEFGVSGHNEKTHIDWGAAWHLV